MSQELASTTGTATKGGLGPSPTTSHCRPCTPYYRQPFFPGPGSITAAVKSLLTVLALFQQKLEVNAVRNANGGEASQC